MGKAPIGDPKLTLLDARWEMKKKNH